MFKLILTGCIGNDAKVVTVNEDRRAINFSVANNYTYMRGDEKVTVTRWVNCVKYVNKGKEKLAEHLTKGKLIAVEGEPEAKAWIDKDNNPQATINLTVENIDFMGGN